MTEISKFITLGLIGLSSLSFFSCSGNNTRNTVPTFTQQELAQAIFFLEGNLGSLSEAGYVQWTPTTAAAELVEIMNTSQILLPEEEEDYRQSGIQPKDPIPYVLNQPTAAWQIVLIADDAQQTIQVKAYGKDLETPLIERELPCCSY
jgi:hypothetical protein